MAVTVDGLSFDAVIVLSLTDEQLAIIEDRRAGSDLRIMLDANVVLGYDPAVSDGGQNDRWPARSFQETVWVQAKIWERLLRQSTAFMSLAVVVPVPLDASIDAMGNVGWDAEKAIVTIPKEQRTLTSG